MGKPKTIPFDSEKVNVLLPNQESGANMKRIMFDEKMYEHDEYIEQAIKYCNQYGGTIEIDNDFCVYAFYDGMEHWIGYANPLDLDWFDMQFK